MKKNFKSPIKIALIAALLSALALILRDASDVFRPRGYDPSAPTAAKFARIAAWIPGGAEFYVAADVPRWLANPAIRDGLARLAGDRKGAAADFIASLIERESHVGMLALTGRIGDAGSEPLAAIIAQGDFDEKLVIPSIQAMLAAGRAGLAAEALGKRTLYAESGERDPFGFIVLDREHIAVGSRESLSELFADNPPAREAIGSARDAVIFGRLEVGARLMALIPQGVASISSVDFESPDGQNLVARVVGEMGEARNLKMFLEGMRSLLILQEEDNPALTAILKNLKIDGDERGVSVACDIPQLLDLWRNY